MNHVILFNFLMLLLYGRDIYCDLSDNLYMSTATICKYTLLWYVCLFEFYYPASS